MTFQKYQQLQLIYNFGTWQWHISNKFNLSEYLTHKSCEILLITEFLWCVIALLHVQHVPIHADIFYEA